MSDTRDSEMLRTPTGDIIIPPRPPLPGAPPARPPLTSAPPAWPSLTGAPVLRPRLARAPLVWLLIYAVALALIAFWPTPVDREAAGLLRAISRAIPWLSYSLIEFTANIALFVPLGALGSLLLPGRPLLVVGIAFGVTVLIESVQALLLAQRTPSGLDVIANTLGAVVGIVVVWLVQRRRGTLPSDAP